MRKEIEVKAKVADMSALIAKLEGLGCTISEPIIQHDSIFVAPDYGVFEDFHPGKNLLRVREQGDKIFFTIKQPQKNELDAIEHETAILDGEEMKNALQLMGYRETVQVHKTRRKAHYEKWEICLDEVDNLGSFVELEEIADDTADAEAIQNEMVTFLATVGIDASERVTQGYDTLVYLTKNV